MTKQKQQIKSTEAALTDFVHDIKTPVTALKLLIEKKAMIIEDVHSYLNGHVSMTC